MGSYARFEHYLTTLGVETCPALRPATPVFWPTLRRASAREAGEADRGLIAHAPASTTNPFQTAGHAGESFSQAPRRRRARSTEHGTLPIAGVQCPADRRNRDKQGPSCRHRRASPPPAGAKPSQPRQDTATTRRATLIFISFFKTWTKKVRVGHYLRNDRGSLMRCAHTLRSMDSGAQCLCAILSERSEFS